ncbi:MAG: DUF72 domain-containing protein [Azospirillaceae bacterium]
MAEIRIGTSGWQYRHWVGPVYPEGTKPRDMLARYAERFHTVEVDGTFYSLPSAATVEGWRDGTPDDFRFCLKASRYITHMKKLKDPAESVARFLETVAVLGDKAGPVLFQLPPNWRANPDRLAGLLDALPADCRAAVEFRDESWYADTVRALLREAGATLCVSHLAGHLSPVEATADFAYVRLHGPGAAYQGAYDEETLAGWAETFRRWRDEGRDVFCFLDNDEAGYAALNAARLQELVA